ncbi:hypothetical protein [Smaragdicoccus niigatensis]|uniref:hypothetical protein n=1 Tax=Smaragdicoccus niigatensis TaxID=359359 RepID=UPI00035DBFD6|nr:hypothetical protein [Smaragdicoccus niigatensis]
MALVRLHRPFVSRIVWFSVLAFFAAACSGTADTAGNKQLPAAAEQIMTAAVDTMFTWNPTVDPGPGAAFSRAAPFLSDKANAAVQKVSMDTVADWAKWKKAGDKITADVHVGTDRLDASSEDTDSSFTRPVKVFQNVLAPDGSTTDTFTFTLGKVVVKLTEAQWRVDSISGIEDAGGGLTPPTTSRSASVTTSPPAAKPPAAEQMAPAPVTPVPVTTVPSTTVPLQDSCATPGACWAKLSESSCATPGGCATTPFNPSDCNGGTLCIGGAVASTTRSQTSSGG